LFPKTISDLCDDINKVDYYVAPRWLNPNNPYSEIIRHPGWIAEKVDKSYPTDPTTGDRIYGNLLDPDYLNSDSGYASWLYGGGVLAVPSGKNTGSGTSYVTAIDVNFNNLKNILAQTVFHRINADFPPGKPDLFGNSSLRNEDGTTEESTLHLRGGMIARGPGHGLILPPQKSTPENLRKANLIEAPTGNNVGSSESDDDGYFETDTPYGKNKIDHYIQLEESQSFTDPARFKSTNRKMAQAKRERASFKGGKSFATDVTACESGFENSLVIGYTVPSTKEGSVQYTSIIQLDSFYSNVFENYCVGYPDVSAGNGISLQGKYPFLLSSELLFNSRQVHTFLFTEKSEVEKSLSTNNYVSLIASNTDMRNKDSWFPFVYGESKSDANFSTNSKAFAKTKLNSYSISEDSPLLANVGYADDGAIIFRTIPLNTIGPSVPLNDKNLFIGGKAPTFINEFRLLDTIITDGTPAAEIHPTVSVLSSQEYYVSYVSKENTRTINGKFISNFQPSEKFEIINLDTLAGQKLSDDSDIFGLTSSYDKKLELQRNVFYCNGLLLYFENPVSSSPNGSSRIPKLHLVAGNSNSDFATNLIQRNNLITYYDSNSELNEVVIKHKPAIVSCKNEAYKSSVCVVYDTGKCKLRAVLFNPFETTFSSSSGTASTFRDFDIECISSVDDTTNVNSRKPQAQFSASPLSGITDLNVTFIDESFDFTGSELTYEWDFGDGTLSIEKNPSHVFINSTNADKVFTVSLIVTNNANVKSDPFNVKITVFPKVNDLKPTARFTASPTTGPATLSVNFVNLSKPVSDGSSISFYSWDFYGDGNITTLFDNQDIRVDYTIPGTYKPTLIVEDNFSRKSDKFIGPDIVVSDKPKADFIWKQTSFGPVFGVTFTDKSLPVNTIKSWSWDFGDSQSSTSQNPLHFYELPGKYTVKLIVTNNSNQTDTISYDIVVTGQGNSSPIANFNYNQTDRTFIVNFFDTSTDSDGSIVSWKWFFDLNDLTKTSSIQNPSFTYSSSGTYNVKLEVTDNSGNISFVTKAVTVSPVINQPPIINFVSGVQTSFNPIIVKFTESSSDPDGFIEKWEWNFGDSSPIFSTTSSASKNPSHQYANPGVYDVTLTVTDNGLDDGSNKKTAQKTIQIEVFGPPANKPPIASFNVDNNNSFAPLQVNFTDTSIDTDGFIIKWLWEFETNIFREFNSQTYQKTVGYTFTKSGTYTVKLTVTDNNGLTSTATNDIVVLNTPPVSVFTISPNPINSKETTTFNGTASSDPDGQIVSYNWNFGDNNILSNGPSVVSRVYNRPGTYNIALEVVDNQGARNTSQNLLTVRNRKPKAVITYTSLSVKAPGSLSFSGSDSFDEDGNIVSYAWTVNNGSTSSLVNPSFQFTTEGVYTVTLKVTDDFGDTDTSQVLVNVSPADNIIPTAILKVDKNSGVINDNFVFNVLESFDTDGFIKLYQLDFGDGISTSFVNPALVSHIYIKTGIFNAKLIVTDNRDGISLESTQTITIVNQPPVAEFSFNPVNPQTLQTVNFIDSSTDPENDLKTWEWNFGDGSSFVTSDITQKSPQHQYPVGNKTHTVILTVYDRFNLSSSVSKNIFVTNRIPVAVISTNPLDVNKVITGSAPLTVVFDSLSYDLDGQVTDYEWTITGLVNTPITTKSFTYTFNTPRFVPYTVSHRVKDNDGFSSNVVTVAVKVNPPNEPPVARITANPASNTSFAPVDVTFSGAGSYDPDNIGGPLAYYWDFGNGQTSFEQVAVTRYLQPGTYNVTLKVIDNQDGSNTATLVYIVKNNKPIAVLNTTPADITQVEINTSVAFNSNGSNDPDDNQFINGYKWLVDGVNLNLNTPDISYIFTSVGNHTVTLSVFDNFGLESDPVNKTIFVVRTPPPPPPNKNPIAVISNEPGVTGNIELKSGDIYVFDGTLSYDPEDGSNIKFEWYLDGVLVGTSSQLTYTFNTVGLFTVSLVVTDTQNLKSSSLTNLDRRFSILVNVSAVPRVDANKLFTTGQAINGAIVSGAYEPNRYGYQLVDDTKKYVIIEAGLKHSFFVDDLGILYGSGDNTYGQLGLPSSISKVNVLTKIPLNSKFKVLKVSAGDKTSAIIVEDSLLNKKVLLVCGDNSSGTFGQALPRNTIYGFQSILERNLTNSALNFSNNDSLLDVSTCQYITAFADNKKVWVAGKHNYSPTSFVNEIGFIGIDVRQNPDLFLTTPMMPFKIEVGFFDPTSPNDFVGYVTGIAFDPDNQIVWFAGKTNLRGWGYAYDISTYENRIGVLLADTDPYFNRAIYFYGFTSTNEIPAFLISPGTAAESQNFLPGDPQAETFQKVSVSNFGYLALSENNYWPWGDNSNGELGFASSYKDTLSENAKNGRFPGDISSVPDIVNPTDISAGGFHSLLIASSAKPATNTFTFVKTGGYPNPEVLTAYPTEQAAQ
jgi:PKD repeat protein